MKRLVLFALALLALPALPAQAAEIFCPGTPGLDDREFSASITAVDGTASCYASGTGNVNGDDADFNGWDFLDKNDGNGASDNGLFSNTGNGGLSGTFTLDPTFWDTHGFALLLLKSGEGQQDPDWVAFLLTPVVTNLDWAIYNDQAGGNGAQALSHFNLYASGEPRCVDCPPPPPPPPPSVPEPGTLALLGFGLLGLGWTRRRAQA